MEENSSAWKVDRYSELEERQIINGATDQVQWSANETYSKWAHTHRSKRDSERLNRAQSKPAVWRQESLNTEPLKQTQRTARPTRLPPLVRPARPINTYETGRNALLDKYWKPSKIRSSGKVKTCRGRIKMDSPIPSLYPARRITTQFDHNEDLETFSETRSPSTHSVEMNKAYRDMNYTPLIRRTFSTNMDNSTASQRRFTPDWLASPWIHSSHCPYTLEESCESPKSDSDVCDGNVPVLHKLKRPREKKRSKLDKPAKNT